MQCKKVDVAVNRFCEGVNKKLPLSTFIIDGKWKKQIQEAYYLFPLRLVTMTTGS